MDLQVNAPVPFNPCWYSMTTLSDSYSLLNVLFTKYLYALPKTGDHNSMQKYLDEMLI